MQLMPQFFQPIHLPYIIALANFANDDSLQFWVTSAPALNKYD